VLLWGVTQSEGSCARMWQSRAHKIKKLHPTPRPTISKNMSPKQFLTLLACALAMLSSAHAIPAIAPSTHDCGNGVSCASTQTCMSDARGAGMKVRKCGKHSVAEPCCKPLLWQCLPLPGVLYAQTVSNTCPSVCLLPSPQRRALQRCSLLLPRCFHLRQGLQVPGCRWQQQQRGRERGRCCSGQISRFRHVHIACTLAFSLTHLLLCRIWHAAYGRQYLRCNRELLPASKLLQLLRSSSRWQSFLLRWLGQPHIDRRIRLDYALRFSR
jgi:hypothetical protein